MRNHPAYIFVASVLMFGVLATGQAQEVDTRWRLRVENLQHELKVEATIRFTADPDPGSCMIGAWKRLVVEAKTAQDETFFPLAEPLSYELRGGKVTLGRTSLCDGYLFMTGISRPADINGPYDAVSISGSSKLGYFSLKQIRTQGTH